MHGPGRYVSADGTIFEGTFVADEREGPGIVLYPDGRRYTSTWSAGKDVNAKDALVAVRFCIPVKYVAGDSLGKANPSE